MKPPIVGADLWQRVMNAAGDRCECQGACGKKHADRRTRKQGRCEHVNGWAPLLAVPRDPGVPWHEAAQLPAEGLAAFCEDCHDAVRRAIKHEAKNRPPQADGLFDLSDGEAA